MDMFFNDKGFACIGASIGYGKFQCTWILRCAAFMACKNNLVKTVYFLQTV